MEATAQKVEQGSSPKLFDPSVKLSPGVHEITYKVTSKNGVGKPVTCSHTVTVALHTCEALNFADNIYLGPIKDQIKTHFVGCLKAGSGTQEDVQAPVDKVTPKFSNKIFKKIIKIYKLF